MTVSCSWESSTSLSVPAPTTCKQSQFMSFHRPLLSHQQVLLWMPLIGHGKFPKLCNLHASSGSVRSILFYRNIVSKAQQVKQLQLVGRWVLSASMHICIKRRNWAFRATSSLKVCGISKGFWPCVDFSNLYGMLRGRSRWACLDIIDFALSCLNEPGDLFANVRGFNSTFF